MHIRYIFHQRTGNLLASQSPLLSSSTSPPQAKGKGGGCSSRAFQSARSFCHSCFHCLSALAHSTSLYHPGVWLLSPWVVAAVQREANCTSVWIDVFTPHSAACEWTGRPLANSLAACSSTAFLSLKSYTARSRCWSLSFFFVTCVVNVEQGPGVFTVKLFL